ncbi:MAG: hypothetical protein WBR13_13490 [Allosphingosinicella sp.]
MTKLKAAIAGTLCLLVLSSCGSTDPATAENTVVAAEENRLDNGLDNDLAAQPGAPANEVDGAIPPPDAVSHPDGFLPPAPAEPEPTTANSSDPGAPQRATEDEYIRNGQ